MDDYNYDYEDEEYSSPESMEEAEQLPGDWDAKITQTGKQVEVGGGTTIRLPCDIDSLSRE